MATAAAKTPKTKTAPPPSTGSLIDQHWAAREEKRRLEEQVKAVEKTIAELDTQLLERMDAEGLEKATGTKATASISKSVVADVQDWDAFWAFIAKKKFFHLVQRRVSDPAYRELLEAGTAVPGVQPFPKRKLNLRSL
jgi:hypothetical protein